MLTYKEITENIEIMDQFLKEWSQKKESLIKKKYDIFMFYYTK